MRLAGALVTLLLGLVLAPAASASYGGAPVPPSQGAALAYFQWTAADVLGECSGVLVAQRAVLTAAHCVRSTTFGHHTVTTVRIGNPRGRSVRLPVKRVRVHPAFAVRHPERGSDLAVLILARGANRPSLRVARDPQAPVQGAHVEIEGFGVTRTGQPPNDRRVPRAVRLEVLSPFNCVADDIEAFDATRWCGASPTAATCPGDSGGPAIARDADGRELLVGVVSYALEETPCRAVVSVLTRVSAFRGWLRTAARP